MSTKRTQMSIQMTLHLPEASSFCVLNNTQIYLLYRGNDKTSPTMLTVEQQERIHQSRALALWRLNKRRLGWKPETVCRCSFFLDNHNPGTAISIPAYVSPFCCLETILNLAQVSRKQYLKVVPVLAPLNTLHTSLNSFQMDTIVLPYRHVLAPTWLDATHFGIHKACLEQNWIDVLRTVTGLSEFCVDLKCNYEVILTTSSMLVIKGRWNTEPNRIQDLESCRCCCPRQRHWHQVDHLEDIKLRPFIHVSHHQRRISLRFEYIWGSNHLEYPAHWKPEYEV